MERFCFILTLFCSAITEAKRKFKIKKKFFLFPACLWFPALSCGNGRWEAVHLWQRWIWSSGSKVNIQQDAAWKGGCPRGIPCGAGTKWIEFVFILKTQTAQYKIHSEIKTVIKYNKADFLRCHAVSITHWCCPLMAWWCGHLEMGIMAN